MFAEEDEEEDMQLPTLGRKQRLSKAASEEADDKVVAPSVKRVRAIVLDADDADRGLESSRDKSRTQRQADGKISPADGALPHSPDAADLLAAEGLEPIEDVAGGSRSTRARKSAKAGVASIRDRMQQNQQRIRTVRALSMQILLTAILACGTDGKHSCSYMFKYAIHCSSAVCTAATSIWDFTTQCAYCDLTHFQIC